MNNSSPISYDGALDLQSMVAHAEVVQSTDTLEVAHASFERHGQAFMAVFEDGQIIGLCSRRRLGMALGSRTGLEKHLQRPVYEFMLPEMTVVRVGQPLADVLSVVFSRPEETMLNEVVLMDDMGQFIGLIHARSLVKVQYLLLRQNVEQIEQSRRELNAKNEEMENDLRLASEIQLALLPAPVTKTATSRFQIAHRYHPMQLVSGDFFQRLDLGPDKVGIFVCDVMGHGVRSAFITAMLRALIQELSFLGDQPASLLSRINEELKMILQHTDSPLYATAVYCLLDAAAGKVTFACAGHPDALLLQPGQWIAKNVSPAPKTKGPALGMRAGATYGQTEFAMSPGETLLLFTDGLCEIFNDRNEEFGREQLAQSAQTHAAQPLDGLLDGMVGDALAFASGQFQDDVCLVGLELVS